MNFIRIAENFQNYDNLIEDNCLLQIKMIYAFI